MTKVEHLGENLLKDLDPGDAKVRGGHFMLALRLFSFPEDTVEEALVTYLVDVAKVAEERIRGPIWAKALGHDLEVQFGRAISQLISANDGKISSVPDSNVFCDQEGLKRLLRPTIANCRFDASSFAVLNEDAAELLAEPATKNLANAFELVKEGFELAGIERSESLRLAKIELQEVLTDPGASNCPTVQFLGGVLQSVAIYSGGDAPQLMSRALHLGFASRIGLSNLAHWSIGRAFLQKEEKSDALTHFNQFKARKGEFLPWLDLARLQLDAGNTNRAREAIGTALECSPIALVYLFADSAFEREAVTIASKSKILAATLSNRVKANAKALRDWELLLAKAEGAYGGRLTLSLGANPVLSQESPGPSSQCALELLALGVQLERQLDQKKAEATTNLEKAVEKLQEDISKKRTELVKFDGKKAESINRARQIFSHKLTQVQVEQKKSEMEGLRAEKGCMWSFGYGLLMFGVYVITVAIFAFGGNNEAYKSPLALLIAVAGVFPIAMSVIVQISTLIRRGAAKAACIAMHKEAQADLDANLKTIEAEYASGTQQINAAIADLVSQESRTNQAKAMLDPSAAMPQAA